MATRRELIAAIRARYAGAPRAERAKILDELVAVAGYHRKHAIRVLGVDIEVDDELARREALAEGPSAVLGDQHRTEDGVERVEAAVLEDELVEVGLAQPGNEG